MSSKAKKFLGLLSTGTAVLATAYIYYENNTLEETFHVIHSSKIKENMRIIHLSDLHSKSFGYNNSKLVDRIKSLLPDIICITGDLTDEHSTIDKSNLYTINLVNALLQIAPVFYVSGNHEYKSGALSCINDTITELGGTVLDGETDEIEVKSNTLVIGGCRDIKFSDYDYKDTLEKYTDNENTFNLFLIHRPDYFEKYSEYNIDLILSGHSHGGQIRLPAIGGIFKPEKKGFFPKYQIGKYSLNNSDMIVSRGLGTSLLPIRTFNKPEIVVIDLTPQEKDNTV